MKISCNIIADILELYADGVVSEDTKGLVETHLNDCAACREKLAGIKKSIIIPAETKAELIKKIGKKIKARHIAYSTVIFALIAAILFVGVKNYSLHNPPEYRLPSITSFSRVKFDRVELRGDYIHVFFNRSTDIGGMSYVFNDDNKTADLHVCLYGRVRSEPLECSYNAFIQRSYDNQEPVEIIAVYYCTSNDCMSWRSCNYSNATLLWEKG
ncbi:MAG: zf-HC2 domain-containing protein [Oscillospiraceae bacterium]|nr:zf-HC2 domain-containing protein [Oscillospiraceae bacterium]